MSSLRSAASIPNRAAAARRSGTGSTPMTRSTPRCLAIRAANCPMGPSPSTASVPSLGVLA